MYKTESDEDRENKAVRRFPVFATEFSATSLVMFRTCLLSVSVLILFTVGNACTHTGSAAETAPQSDLESAADETIRVMSYNIQHGRGMDDEVDLERIARVIREKGAEIVALQEVDVGVERSGRRDIARELSELTNLEYYAFGKNLDHQGGDYGNATLSKYPIVEENNTHFTRLGPEQRGILETVIDVNGWSLLVMNTHLDYRGEDDSERLLYVRGARDKILPGYDVEAVIFAGDFNDVPESSTHLEMKEFMTDAWEASGEGEGLTIPPDDPQRRIDYIFYKGEIVSEKTWVPVTQASDHLPVVTDFRRQR